MKFLIIFFGLLAFAAANDLDFSNEEEWNRLVENGNITSEDFGLILDKKFKKMIRQTLDQMPCGWPEHNIPPLAPYTKAQLELHLAKSVVDVVLKLIRFRLDGLNEMKIKKLDIHYTFNKKVKYHFIFEELKANATALTTNVFIDLMKELGLEIGYKGRGPFEVSLRNLELKGQFKYKMPIFAGSIRIYKFKIAVSLGSVQSNIGILPGKGPFNKMINDEIEQAIPELINGNQEKISARLEENVVPVVNTHLKGKKMLYVLKQMLKNPQTCHPDPAPWTESE